MKPRKFSDCLDPEFEALMAEQDKIVENKFEEIETISSGVDADKILSGTTVRMPSGEWKQVESKDL